MKKFKFTLGDAFQNNRVVLIFSIIAAIAIWITVSPNRQTTVGVTVNIDTGNATLNTLGLEIIEGQGQRVDVVVEGKWYVISRLTEKDIKVTPTLTDVTKSGEYLLNLSASKSSNVSDYEILKITPEKIRVKFDYTFTRGFEVKPKVNGVKAAEGLIADTPVIDTSGSILQVTGPKSIIETIGSVVAEVDANATLTNSTTYLAKVKILDINGREIDVTKLTLPFTEVNITVPINKAKTLPVVTSFINQPAAYIIEPIPHSISVSKIDVVGPAEVIDALTEIKLDPINFSAISPSNYVFNYTLSLPSGVRTTNDIDKVTVTINMSSFTKKSIDVSRFVPINAPPGKKVTVITSKKTVEVIGPKNVISALKSEDLYLRYDLSDFANASGEHLVSAAIISDKYNNVWGKDDYQIQIKIE